MTHKTLYANKLVYTPLIVAYKLDNGCDLVAYIHRQNHGKPLPPNQLAEIEAFVRDHPEGVTITEIASALKALPASIADGFHEGEFDLPTLFNRESVKRDDFIAAIIDPIVNVLRASNAGASLSVAGHSDRFDGSSNHIRCLEVERIASEKRVESAIAHIHELVRQREPSAPADLNTLRFFDVHLRAPGAGALVHDDAALSEAQRRENRRIQAPVGILALITSGGA